MARLLANRWLALAAWIAIIYAAIPFVRGLREEFVTLWPAEFLGFAVMGVVAATAGAALWALRRRKTKPLWADAMWLAGVAAVFVVWTWLLMEQPEEAVHFVEYGVLGVLSYRALRPNMNNPGVFVAAALIGTIVGTVDEIIQWIVPGRYWDFRDLVLNGGTSVLVQFTIWRLASRPFLKLTPSTIHTLCRLAVVEWLLLMLCLAATPQRLIALAQILPVLEPLAEGNDVISEYGFLHRLDATTFFRSRLSQSELAFQDDRRSAEAAAKLNRSEGRYGAFQRSVTPVSDPFSYEARIHVFARDTHLAEARRSPAGSRQHRRAIAVAAREHQILTQIFGDTLERSIFRWSDGQRSAVDAAQDLDRRFVSKVAGHLITSISEPMLRALMLAVLIALVVADVVLGRRISLPRLPTTRE